ncbi:MAG TPA: DUF397 domain-containing protein [Streptosporangiaceae bacterium]
MGDSEQSPTVWRKSMASGGSNCVEVCTTSMSVFVRHSQSPSGPVLKFSFSEWEAFLTGVRDGEFDAGQRGHSEH